MRFVLFRFASLRFVSFRFVLFYIVLFSFRVVLCCVVSFRFVSSRFVTCLYHQIWLCAPCGEKYTKRNYCPTCGVTYDDADNSVKAVGCSACEFWVHAACAGLSSVGVAAAAVVVACAGLSSVGGGGGVCV